MLTVNYNQQLYKQKLLQNSVLTFLEVPLKGADATAPKNSVQFQVVYHTNSFVATYGSVTPTISVVLGPSLGLGPVPGFIPRMVA